jgi:hypothetical protein
MLEVPLLVSAGFICCCRVRPGIDQQKNMVSGVDLSEFNVIVIQRNKEEAANREWWRSKICCVNGWKDKN